MPTRHIAILSSHSPKFKTGYSGLAESQTPP